MTKRRIAYLLLLVFLFAALTACGGSPAPSDSAAGSFKVDAVSTDIAQAGDVIHVSGAGLEAASVLLADTPITPSAQSASRIVFNVPATVPPGPQQLTVTVGTETSVHDLFIGVDFPTGALADLAALHLPAATAVRLGATTYDVSDLLVLENLSLYGAGPDATTLTLPSYDSVPPVGLMLAFDTGVEVAIQDMTIALGVLYILERTPAMMWPTSLPEQYGDDWFTTQVESMDLSAHPQAARPGSLTFENVHFVNRSPDTPGIFFANPTAPFSGTLRFVDTTLSGNNLGVVAFAAGVEVIDSTFSVTFDPATPLPGMQFISLLSPLVANHSNFEARGDETVMLHLMGMEGLQIDGVSALSTGVIWMVRQAGPALVPIRALMQVENSTFTVPALPGGIHPGQGVTLGGQGVHMAVNNATFNLAGSLGLFSELGSSISVNDTEFTLGNPDAPDDAVRIQIGVGLSESGRTEITNSRIAFVGKGEIGLTTSDGTPTDTGLFRFNNNVVTGLTGKSVTAFNMLFDELEAEFTVEMLDNTFTNFERAFRIEMVDPTVGLVSGEIHGNDFAFDMVTPGSVAILTNVQQAKARFDATRNRWQGNNSSAAVEGRIQLESGSELAAFIVNPVITP